MGTHGKCGANLKINFSVNLNISEGHVLVFNNENMNHALKILENNSPKNKEKKESTRKIVCFFIVAPGKGMEGQSTKEKMVNMEDKYELIIQNWYRSVPSLFSFVPSPRTSIP